MWRAAIAKLKQPENYGYLKPESVVLLHTGENDTVAWWPYNDQAVTTQIYAHQFEVIEWMSKESVRELETRALSEKISELERRLKERTVDYDACFEDLGTRQDTIEKLRAQLDTVQKPISLKELLGMDVQRIEFK